MAYHGPSNKLVLDHEVSDKWSVLLAHVSVVVLFAHAGFSVGAYGPD